MHTHAPKTAWEWLEAYGAMNAEGDKVHGDWKTARREVEEKLDRLITAEEMEALLRKTKAIALKPAEQIMVKGSGWGALENMRREADGEDPLPTHLDFGELDTPQQPWTYLLKNGYMKEESPDREPRSWMFQKEWTKRLEKPLKMPIGTMPLHGSIGRYPDCGAEAKEPKLAWTDP